MLRYQFRNTCQEILRKEAPIVFRNNFELYMSCLSSENWWDVNLGICLIVEQKVFLEYSISFEMGKGLANKNNASRDILELENKNQKLLFAK